jgi:predicted NBD/HSP70 family sugar kinase
MAISPNDVATAPRERTVQAVLDALRDEPRRSRAELAQRTGLSKPTVASALRSLEQGGLVRERGRSTGRRGPSASLYEPIADAALVLGIDVGAHHVRACLTDLDAQPHAETDLVVDGADAEHVLQALRNVRERLARPSLELAVVGSPGVVDPDTGRIRSSPAIAGWEGMPAETVLRDVLRVDTVVENDVNLAALGELHRGAGKGRSSFAYLNVGSGLGAGLVLNGQLHRGRHGAAGEVGYLAVGEDPIAESDESLGPMERRLSQDAIVRAARAIDPSSPEDPRELFARARRADPLGQRVVADTVQALAVCIASMTAVLDLELVLLGGGIGAQSDLLLEPVRTATRTLVPYAPEIAPAQLGDHATLAGAAAVGAELTRAALIRRSVAAR